MSLIIIIATIWGISALISHIRQERLAEEQMRQREAQARLLREQRAYAQAQREETARLIALEKARQAQEKMNEKFEREQARQAEAIRKHEERLFKLEQRMASAESELAFNREQRDRLFKLLDIEERERDGAIPESATWQKHQRKVISLENQIHTVQKRIDKAQADRLFCEKQMSA